MRWLNQANVLLVGLNYATRSSFTTDAMRPRLGLKLLGNVTGTSEKVMNDRVHAVSGIMMEWRNDALQEWIGKEKVGRTVATTAIQWFLLASARS